VVVRKGDGPWIAAATCAIATMVLVVCITALGWPFARSLLLALAAGFATFAVLYVVSLVTNDGTPGGWHRRE